MIFLALGLAVDFLLFDWLFLGWSKHFRMEYMPGAWPFITLVAAFTQASAMDNEPVTLAILCCFHIPLFGHWIGGYWYRRAGAHENRHRPLSHIHS